MVKIDAETGEVLDYDPSDDPAVQEIVPDLDFDEWGDEAHSLLQAVTEGPHYRKKRRTLLHLAEAAYLNVSQASVFRRPDCSSKVAHYKWKKEDPAYRDAYEYLVGDSANPGLARLQRERELDEDEALAISSLAEARVRLRLASADAVKTLIDALDAKDRFGPMWRERIVAANSILDRADADTAARRGPSVSLVDKAIMTVYANADSLPDASHPQLPPGDEGSEVTADEPTVSNDEHVIDNDE